MIPYRTWFFTALRTVLGVILVIASVNAVVDVYGVFRSDFSRQVQEPNKSFVKIKYLLRNKNKFDSFVFGSSRVNHIDLGSIRSGTYYNMTYSEGLPREHLENVKFLLKNGVAIKNILIGLDDFSYRVDPQRHSYDLLRQPHPGISGKSWLTFYSEYLLKVKRLVPSVKSYITYNYLTPAGSPEKKFSYDLYSSGRTLCATCEEDIERAPEKHRSNPKFEKPFHYEGDNLERTISDLRELAALAEKNNIRLILFINPIHKTTYLDTDLPLLFRFKERLAGIADYYDFSGLNSITTDNYYYFEASHYRPKVGNMMLRRMLGEPAVKAPRDFGVFVTRENVQDHLAKLSRQLEQSGIPWKQGGAAAEHSASAD